MGLLEACKLVDVKNIFGANLGGENLYTITIPKNCMLVIGSESHGISAENTDLLTKHITIPQAKDGTTESLNAAVATSIIL
jgi:TrmH family RNA methyltransferase